MYTLFPYATLFRSSAGFRTQRTRSTAEDVHDRALRVPGADGGLVPAVAVCRIPAGDEQGCQHRGAGGGVRMLGTGGRVVGAHQLVLQPRVLAEIGRASCRERVCQYVWISVVAG